MGEQARKQRAMNEFLKDKKVFNGVIEFDKSNLPTIIEDMADLLNDIKQKLINYEIHGLDVITRPNTKKPGTATLTIQVLVKDKPLIIIPYKRPDLFSTK